MGNDVFMSHPTQVYLTWLSTRGERPGFDFERGRMAMALEMVTTIRAIEDLPVVDDRCKATVVAALETLIVEQGLENAYVGYERLNEWRKPTFGPVERVPVREHADASDVQPRLYRKPDGASFLAVPEVGPVPQGSPDASPVGRRDPRVSTTSEQWELTDAEGSGMSSGGSISSDHEDL